MASWLVHLSRYRVDKVCVLARDITLCSLLSQCLSPGIQMGSSKFNAEDNPEMDKHRIQGGVEILLVAKCY